MPPSGLVLYPGNHQPIDLAKAAESVIGSLGLCYICMKILAFDLAQLT